MIKISSVRPLASSTLVYKWLLLACESSLTISEMNMVGGIPAVSLNILRLPFDLLFVRRHQVLLELVRVEWVGHFLPACVAVIHAVVVGPLWDAHLTVFYLHAWLVCWTWILLPVICMKDFNAILWVVSTVLNVSVRSSITILTLSLFSSNWYTSVRMRVFRFWRTSGLLRLGYFLARWVLDVLDVFRNHLSDMLRVWLDPLSHSRSISSRLVVLIRLYNLWAVIITHFIFCFHLDSNYRGVLLFSLFLCGFGLLVLVSIGLWIVYPALNACIYFLWLRSFLRCVII